MSYHDSFNLAVDQAEREIVEPWRIVTDTVAMPPAAVLAGAQAFSSNPLPGQWHRNVYDTDLMACTFELQEEENPVRWVCNVVYKLVIDPTTEPPILRRSVGQTEWAIERALDTTPGSATFNTMTAVKNTAGDPFDPPLTVPSGHLIMTITRNFASINDRD